MVEAYTLFLKYSFQFKCVMSDINTNTLRVILQITVEHVPQYTHIHF